MPEISPKQEFIRFLPDIAKETRSQLPLPWFRLAAQAALAHFSTTSNPTAEEMAGARKFLNVLLEIGDVPPEIHRLPEKRLETLDR